MIFTDQNLRDSTDYLLKQKMLENGWFCDPSNWFEKNIYAHET